MKFIRFTKKPRENPDPDSNYSDLIIPLTDLRRLFITTSESGQNLQLIMNVDDEFSDGEDFTSFIVASMSAELTSGPDSDYNRNHLMDIAQQRLENQEGIIDFTDIETDIEES